jgi:hypothetical protein
MATTVFQFKLTLQDVKPMVWRRIQLPDSYTFWDLHVAIQDAMGWTDSHLHEFTVVNPNTGDPEAIGTPIHDDPHHPILAEWDLKIRDYLKMPTNHKIHYLYDFGDSWEHILEFEGAHEKQQGKYPVCLAGERACPPEDVGGAPGYEHFLSVINKARHPERKSLLEWVGGKFDPDKFNPQTIKFNNPQKRWKTVFEDVVHF